MTPAHRFRFLVDDDLPRPTRVLVARAWTAVLFGVVVAAASVIWFPNPFVYGIGLAFVLIGGAIATAQGLSGRRLLIGRGIVAAVVVAALVVPWQAAVAEQRGNADWTVSTGERVGQLFADGDRVLGLDRSGIFAVSIADGSTQWRVSELGQVSTYMVSTDGYVFARAAGDGADHYAWISPDGEIVWERTGPESRLGLTNRTAVPMAATAGGIVVTRTCDAEAAGEPCVYEGIDPDGETLWTETGYEGPLLTGPAAEARVSSPQPGRLPEIALIDSDPDKTGTVRIVAPDTGTELHRVDVDPHMFASGDVVVSLSGGGESGEMCLGDGWSVDGDVDWSAEVPCFEPGNLMMGPWIYGELGGDTSGDAEGDSDIDAAFALDSRTGTWQDVGGLSWFNVDVDDRTGVPGPDVVVQRRDQLLTGVDPASGDRLWELQAPLTGIPGVDEGWGGTSALGYAVAGHNPFFSGEQRDSALSMLAIDSATGQITGTLTTTDTLWTSVTVGPGQVVVVYGDRMSLIGRPSL